ncbi:hypothetical protein ACHAWF_017270 [Thalassiosira exigua]
MSKLVNDPIDAAPFLPLLLPALETNASSIANPKARGVIEKAVEQLNRLKGLTEKGVNTWGDMSKLDAGFRKATCMRRGLRQSDIQGKQSHLICIEYVFVDEEIQALGMPRWTSSRTGRPSRTTPCSPPLGGWRMKLALTRAMLQKANILLMDELTIHFDVINVAWAKKYINSLINVTANMASHDSSLLNDCCKIILQIEDLKLLTTNVE